MIAYAIQDGRGLEKAQNGLGISGEDEPSYTVDTTGAQSVAFSKSRRAKSADDHETWVERPIAPTMNPFDTSATRVTTVAVDQQLGVRRLTPRECERLQGFPDDHTLYRVDASQISDTQRYRMIGNAVTVNVSAWLGRRITECLPTC